VHQSVTKELDEATLKQTLLDELLTRSQRAVNAENMRPKDQQMLVLEEQKKIVKETIAQYPLIQSMALSKVLELDAISTHSTPVLLINVTSKKAFASEDQRRLIAWLKIRTDVAQVRFLLTRAK
jgi:hypothetical protein